MVINWALNKLSPLGIFCPWLKTSVTPFFPTQLTATWWDGHPLKHLPERSFLQKKTKISKNTWEHDNNSGNKQKNNDNKHWPSRIRSTGSNDSIASTSPSVICKRNSSCYFPIAQSHLKQWATTPILICVHYEESKQRCPGEIWIDVAFFQIKI